MSDCCSKSEPKKLALSPKLKVTGLIFLSLFLLSYIPNFSQLNQSILFYLKLLILPVFLGFFIGGLIDYFIPDEIIFKYLGQKKKSSIFYAVILGFLSSACCHGTLAIAIQLYKKGASISSIVTFLLASPWANFAITLLLFSFFGIKALAIIFGAIGIAFMTGLIFMVFFHENRKTDNQSIISQKIEWTNIKNFNFKSSLKGVFRSTFQLTNMVLWWILIGFMVAVLIRTYVPSHIIMSYFGPDIKGMFLTLFGATVIEVCSEGSSPLAFEIYNHIGTIGNPFIFLMAGVATDYTEIGLVWTQINKKAAILIPLISIPQIMILAWLFNLYL